MNHSRLLSAPERWALAGWFHEATQSFPEVVRNLENFVEMAIGFFKQMPTFCIVKKQTKKHHPNDTNILLHYEHNPCGRKGPHGSVKPGERGAGGRGARHHHNRMGGYDRYTGEIFADKANAATAPVAFLLPLRGVSILDGDGQPFETARPIEHSSMRLRIIDGLTSRSSTTSTILSFLPRRWR
uniref:Uncharacterized protein n=1 Tax=Entomoneis paludosa TaxID=265537 RepID=A0A7S2Y1T6_9STRA|mmetsp:Transcript_10101/g.20860  ORF Transcript_10101/g.20860 Transcript_10101/m.20860 type:complete len:184 (+) Transcript_10101:585-1136(+)